ncbi:MAG: hypothetical protein S4CHLAM123_08790 [Chlamydiales bacterium]|nr:hypothetical protein [Chlamydiales bacterium]
MLFAVGVFVYHELFPEYKTYQYVYKDLEQYKAETTGEKPPPFTMGIKQILIPNEGGGPEVIDRCTSCHVALNLPHFSPTQVAHDVNENVVLDSQGNPVLEANPNYIWAHLEKNIANLRHPSVNEQLNQKQVKRNLSDAEQLEQLKTVHIDGKPIDVEKVLQMHPLIGAETRPFEYHSMEEYGCTSCHGGNGQALVAKRAHGPVYDGEYEPSFEGFKPQFTEIDAENDPQFAQMYNHKPGHNLVFQTTPLLAGPLMEAKCVQCHQSTKVEIQSAIDKFSYFTEQKEAQIKRMEEGIENDRKALLSLLTLHQLIYKEGEQNALEHLNEKLGDSNLSYEELDSLEGQYRFLKENRSIEQGVQRIVRSEDQTLELLKNAVESDDIPLLVNSFLQENPNGVIANKEHIVAQKERVLTQFKNSQEPLERATQDPALVEKMHTNVDRLISNYTRGKELFISQACYACHRIAGFSRASIGPELTKAGLSYPWYIKESIVWPQADLPSSTMPNFRLDHTELQDLMTFLMAQKGETKAISEVDYQIKLSEWDAGAKMPWEEPVSPTQIKNVQKGQIVYATEGCASCHKLQGFESNINLIPNQQEWFYKLFPEQIQGSKLAKVVQENAVEIDRRIVAHEPKGEILEEIAFKYPGLIEGFYTNFKFASRKDLSNVEYQDRLHRVLMVYIQEYGLGRDIAPHLNWSGVYRDNAWLLGHFHNPSAYTARSIMPAMPFDDTKFYMLNHMLHVLGRKNRDQLQDIWHVNGFNPALAYEVLCSSCHGEHRQGNGIIAEWIYPVPKNLRNPVFLRNLTKQRAIDSITHGVSGTPMPPWGESISPQELGDNEPVLGREEIVQLVDWLYRGIPYEPRQESEEEYKKWNYDPDDVVIEMEKENDLLSPAPPKDESDKERVHAYFEARPNPIPSPDKELYYIREKYYTPANLAEAKEYFDINCATCHGKEGTGTGLRSTTMVEAKPRMFTNLPWLRTRDDLRLLRSIKYGVPGTAMTPWGDQTTAAQRMQLVMYIRELTRGPLLRNELEDILYEEFNQTQLLIEEARAHEYSLLDAHTALLNQKQQDLLTLSESTTAKSEEIGSIYANIVTLKQVVKEGKTRDALYKKLIELIEEERVIYATLGAQLIAANAPESVVENYFELVRTQPLKFSFKNKRLNLESSSSKQPALEELFNYLDTTIATYEENIEIEQTKFRSPEGGKIIQELMNEQGVWINLRTKLKVQLNRAQSLRQEQAKLAEEIEAIEQLKDL